MAILEILEYPDPRLKVVADLVSEITEEIRQQVQDMIETMHHDHGGGLAATQVNIPLRMFVMDGPSEPGQPLVFINPEIVATEGEVEEVEGCLSFPGVSAKVKRPRYVKVKALDIEGNPFEKEYDNCYEARCVHHEIDHLEGVTFFDRLKPLKRQMLDKKIEKYKRSRM